MASDVRSLPVLECSTYLYHQTADPSWPVIANDPTAAAADPAPLWAKVRPKVRALG